jgi:hypothetical protein
MPTLALPPIDHLPADGPGPNLLADFARRRARGWGGVPADLSAGVVGALWVLFCLDLVLGGWLLAVRAGAASSSGVVGRFVTLGDHPLLTLVLVAICVGALVVAAPMTRGLARANGPQLGLIVLGALSGAVAISGALAVLAGGLVCLALAFLLFAFVVDRL